MATILISALPIDGHVRPLLPVAAELVNQGHRVHFYTGPQYEQLLEPTGVVHEVTVHGTDYSDVPLVAAAADGSERKPGIKALAGDAERVFVGTIPGHLRDLTQIIERVRPDVLVGDSGSLALTLAAERHQVPLAVVGISVLSMLSVDTAPTGLGLLPWRGPIGRARNRLLNAVVRRLMKDVQASFNRVRADAGLPPIEHFIFDHTVIAADVYLQASIPSLEYPRSNLPASVRFVGPATQPANADKTALPSWWRELDGSKPVILVTQGTISVDPTKLLRPAVRALANEDVIVVATTKDDPATAIPLAERGANLRAEAFIPFATLLPKVDVMITNGGYGGVQAALAAGVPLVVAGKTEEKMEVNARVAWSGAGIDLGVDRPESEAIRAAVRQVLAEPRFQARAEELAAEYARYDGTAMQARAILELVPARSQAPAKAKAEA